MKLEHAFDNPIGVFTGVEVVPGDDGRLRVITHKSERFDEEFNSEPEKLVKLNRIPLLSVSVWLEFSFRNTSVITKTTPECLREGQHTCLRISVYEGRTRVDGTSSCICEFASMQGRLFRMSPTHKSQHTVNGLVVLYFFFVR